MKIMLVAPYFLPKIGGLENYVYNLAKELQDRHGYEVFVVAANHESKKTQEDTYEGIRVIRLPILINLSNTPINPFWYFTLRRIIKMEKPDIINTHSPVPFIADMALIAARKTPTILTYHAGSMKKSSGLIDTVLGIYENVFLPRLLHKANCIATVYPEFIEQRLRQKDKAKLFYAPPCIDPQLFHPSIESTKPSDHCSLLFVGRIELSSAWKGLDVLLKALKEVVDLPGIQLRIVGSGDAVETYRQQAVELGISDKVEFVGKLNGTALADAYRQASMLILPSKSDAEAFGTVSIEAMACGTPVIASNIGGVPNVINATGGGMLVGPNDPAALGTAIRELATNEALRAEFAKAGMESVQRSFIWQSTAQAYVSHMSALAQARKPTIFQITPYFPPHLGGMENVAQEISVQLAERSQTVRVITSNVSYTQDFEDAPVLQGRIDRLKTTEIANLPIMWGLLFRLLRTPQRSIFHVHIAQAFIPEIALLVARLGRSKFIAHFHLDAGTTGGTFSFIFTLYKKTLFPVMLRRSDKVIVFSNEQKELVQNKFHVQPEKIIIIPNGVTLPNPPIQRHYRSAGTSLLSVGRLSPQKRTDRLIDAMQYMPTGIHLDIVGSGDTEASLKMRAKELKLQNVEFHGALYSDKLVAMYTKADMFVTASDREGMSLVMLEAMAASLPIVASDVIGNHELVKDIGVLVAAPYGPEQFATVIAANLSVDRLQTLSRQSFTAAEQYSWEVLIGKLEALYEELSA